MNRSDNEIANRIRKTMIDVLSLALSVEDLADDISLYSPMIQLDSLNMLELLLALEEDFGGHIDDEQVMEADLRTVGDLIALVRAHVHAEVDQRGVEV